MTLEATDPDAPAVVVTAIFHPAPGQRDHLVAALSQTIQAVHAEPGCLLYAIHDSPDGTIVMIEKWESAALLDEHGGGPAVRDLNSAIASLIAQPVTVTRLAPIPAGTAAQGLL